MSKERITYRFTVLGRYEAHLSENEAHVTLTMLAGPAGHLSYCGTLTMSEVEWEVFKDHLQASLKGDVEIDEERVEASKG